MVSRAGLTENGIVQWPRSPQNGWGVFWHLGPNLNKQPVSASTACPLSSAFWDLPRPSHLSPKRLSLASCLPRDLEQWFTTMSVGQSFHQPWFLVCLHIYPHWGPVVQLTLPVQELWSIVSSLSILPVHQGLQGNFHHFLWPVGQGIAPLTFTSP